MIPDYTSLPEHLRTGMRLWIEKGIKPGGFLRACLTNDFIQAATRADGLASKELIQIARWMMFNLPDGSFGRQQVLEQWPLYIGARTRQEQTVSKTPEEI